MTVTESLAVPATRRSLRAQRTRRAPWTWMHAAIVGIATIGVAILLYPTAASWFSDLAHDTQVDGYVQSVTTLGSSASDAALAEARTYNENLPAGPLRDPYVLGANGQQTAVGEGSEAYFNTLKLPGTEAMSRIRIPKIHVDLPVFHGTDESTLARGVGHLYGSALPVGGLSTHSVLTAHNGYVQATLFDNIDQLVVGDVIVLTTLGEDLYYQVDQIKTVKPEEAEDLRQVPGKDYVTLVTCTPTGINTHRLLVRAERIAAPQAAAERAATLADSSAPAGFPWWAVILVSTPIAAAIAVRPRNGRGR